MKKSLLSFLMLLAAWPSLLFADNWTYTVADNYPSKGDPDWLAMCKATNKSGNITPTSKTPANGVDAITWEYSTTMSSTDINAQKDGNEPKGIKLGSADHPMDITFYTKGFANKKITKATIVIKSLSKKCQYKVTATNGKSYTKENVLNLNNSGSANTKGEASFEFNTVADEFSFQVTSTGTTSNTKGGFGFVSISIDYEDTPAATKTPVELKWGGSDDYASTLKFGDTRTINVIANPAEALSAVTLTCNYSEGVDITKIADGEWQVKGNITTEGDPVVLTASISEDNDTFSATPITTSFEIAENTLPSAEISFPASDYEATLGQPFTAPVLSNPHNQPVAYNSTNPAVATVDSDGNVTLVAAGTTVIWASAAATTEYSGGAAQYTLTVTDPNAPQIILKTYSLVAEDFTTLSNSGYTLGTCEKDGVKYEGKAMFSTSTKPTSIQINTKVPTNKTSSADLSGIISTENKNSMWVREIKLTNTDNGEGAPILYVSNAPGKVEYTDSYNATDPKGETIHIIVPEGAKKITPTANDKAYTFTVDGKYPYFALMTNEKVVKANNIDITYAVEEKPTPGPTPITLNWAGDIAERTTVYFDEEELAVSVTAEGVDDEDLADLVTITSSDDDIATFDEGYLYLFDTGTITLTATLNAKYAEKYSAEDITKTITIVKRKVDVPTAKVGERVLELEDNVYTGEEIIFSSATEGAEITYLIDKYDDDTFDSLLDSGNAYTFDAPGVYSVTLEATKTDCESTEVTYTLTVKKPVSGPTVPTVNLTHSLVSENFNHTGSNYTYGSYEQDGVKYEAKATFNANPSSIQINTTADEGGSNHSGILSTENTDKLWLKEIKLTQSGGAGAPKLYVSTEPGTVEDNRDASNPNSKDLKVYPAENATEIEPVITTTVIEEANRDVEDSKDVTETTYTFTVDGNYLYFALVTDGKMVKTPQIDMTYARENIPATPVVYVNGDPAEVNEDGECSIAVFDQITFGEPSEGESIYYTILSIEQEEEETLYTKEIIPDSLEAFILTARTVNANGTKSDPVDIYFNVGKHAADLEFDHDEVVLYLDNIDAFEAPELDNPWNLDVEYMAGETGLKVNEETGAIKNVEELESGTYTIYALHYGTALFLEEDNVFYTLKVMENSPSNTTYTVTYNFAENQYGRKVRTGSDSHYDTGAKNTDFSEHKSVIEPFGNNRFYRGTTKVADEAGNETTVDLDVDLRFGGGADQESGFTISVPAYHRIKSIIFTKGTEGSYGGWKIDGDDDAENPAYDGNGTWTGSAREVTFHNIQERLDHDQMVHSVNTISTITVVYEGTRPTAPNIHVNGDKIDPSQWHKLGPDEKVTISYSHDEIDDSEYEVYINYDNSEVFDYEYTDPDDTTESGDVTNSGNGNNTIPDRTNAPAKVAPNTITGEVDGKTYTLATDKEHRVIGSTKLSYIITHYGGQSEPQSVNFAVPTGVDEIDAEAAEGEAIYFDLQGIRVENPTEGIYIRVLNGQAEKVIF